MSPIPIRLSLFLFALLSQHIENCANIETILFIHVSRWDFSYCQVTTLYYKKAKHFIAYSSLFLNHHIFFVFPPFCFRLIVSNQTLIQTCFNSRVPKQVSFTFLLSLKSY